MASTSSAPWWLWLPLLVVAVALLLGLLPLNARALRTVVRAKNALGAGPARRRAKLAWLISFGALFTGPVAPLAGLVAILVGWTARRAVQATDLKDPTDLSAAHAAMLNGAALIVVSATIAAMLAVAQVVGPPEGQP